MERLTEFHGGIWGMSVKAVENGYDRYSVFSKLAEYEDLGLTPQQLKEIDMLYLEKCQEVNRLNTEIENSVKFPFKVKDTVYLVDFSEKKIDEAEMLQISIYEHGNEYVSDLLTFYDDDINVVVFLTKAEAEKALAESEVEQ